MRLLDSDFTVGQTTGDIDTAAKKLRVTGTAVSGVQDFNTVPGTEDMADTIEAIQSFARLRPRARQLPRMLGHR